VCVDWAAGAVDPNYVRAAVNTRLVGKQVALLIKAINLEFGDINNSTHLVGFSLGAHVSGFVGKELRNLSRITGGSQELRHQHSSSGAGLDPAGPLFEGYSPKVRLDKTDADYVDVIHSNGDSLIIGGLGAWEPIGWPCPFLAEATLPFRPCRLLPQRGKGPAWLPEPAHRWSLRLYIL
jgi:triacylglycerol lipase